MHVYLLGARQRAVAAERGAAGDAEPGLLRVVPLPRLSRSLSLGRGSEPWQQSGVRRGTLSPAFSESFRFHLAHDDDFAAMSHACGYGLPGSPGRQVVCGNGLKCVWVETSTRITHASVRREKVSGITRKSQ